MTILYGQFPQRATPDGSFPDGAMMGQVVILDAARKRGGTVSKAKKPKKTIVTVVQDSPPVESPQVIAPQPVKGTPPQAPQDDFKWVLDSEPFARAMGAVAAAPTPRSLSELTDIFSDDEEEALHLILLLAA